MLRPLLLAFITSALAAQPSRIPVVIQTSLGLIEAELDSAHAPMSVANFLRYVDAGAYTLGRFHRTVRADNQPNNAVKIEVIQGGPAPEAASRGLPPIALERTNLTGLRHLDGTLSMARNGPDTATSDFFIMCRRPARTRFWRQAQRRRPGLRGVRDRDEGNGRRSANPGVRRGRAAARASGVDHASLEKGEMTIAGVRQ